MKSKPRLTSKKTQMGKRIRILFKAIDWILFIIFCVLFVYFTLGVIETYQIKRTFLAQSLQPIRKLPTVVVCIDTSMELELGVSLLIYYYPLLSSKKIKLELDKPTLLKDVNEVVHLEQHNAQCFKLNVTLTSFSSFQPRNEKVIKGM